MGSGKAQDAGRSSTARWWPGRAKLCSGDDRLRYYCGASGET